ncbi:F-box/WD repeat-containing protein 7 [Hondaea fermentalgiana]|uniref:F-box/WD repeat-containing protein 7 n=1 Tax=Hondaea fermentalgiana TaxID=2315210 RepID=A0A2R5GUM4_9STRA|nr:F-box/WD repeat-containing protein 7 [Hondaea fermentalgiana]|eukprot:GBG34265.1 F-box/WD repeat-containing protein 7 [Hondaea fermentalgiana]
MHASRRAFLFLRAATARFASFAGRPRFLAPLATAAPIDRGYVWGVAQSTDFVLAASIDGFLRVWSKQDGALVLEMKTPNDKPAITVAVQGMLAAVGTIGGSLFIIDLTTASVLHALEGHTSNAGSLIFSGNELVSGSYDTTIRFWDKISGRETLRIAAGASVMDLAAYENLLVAGLSDHTVRVFDRANGDPRDVLTEAEGEVNAVAIDAQRMVSGSRDKLVRIYAMPSFELVRVLGKHLSVVTSVALEGHRIVSGSRDKTVILWDARSGRALDVLEGHKDWVKSVSLFGLEVVSGSDDSTVRVWNAETGALIRELNGTEAVPSGSPAEVYLESPIEEVLGSSAEVETDLETAR